jgi:hypothetical protein
MSILFDLLLECSHVLASAPFDAILRTISVTQGLGLPQCIGFDHEKLESYMTYIAEL